MLKLLLLHLNFYRHYSIFVVGIKYTSEIFNNLTVRKLDIILKLQLSQVFSITLYWVVLQMPCILGNRLVCHKCKIDQCFCDTKYIFYNAFLHDVNGKFNSNTSLEGAVQIIYQKFTNILILLFVEAILIPLLPFLYISAFAQNLFMKGIVVEIRFTCFHINYFVM